MIILRTSDVDKSCYVEAGRLRHWKETLLTGIVMQDIVLNYHILQWTEVQNPDGQAYIMKNCKKYTQNRRFAVFPFCCFVKA